MKTSAKAQTDMAKLSLEAQKAAAEDDRERDKMAQTCLFKALRLPGNMVHKLMLQLLRLNKTKLELLLT